MPETPVPYKVLVIEDDPDIADLVRLVLQQEGYDVAQAVDGLEALAILLDPDAVALLLLDMRLPRMDGWAFSAALRSDPAHAHQAHLPIIVMTAAANAQTWATQIGAQAYLSKPFSLDDIRTTVRAFLAPPAPPEP